MRRHRGRELPGAFPEILVLPQVAYRGAEMIRITDLVPTPRSCSVPAAPRLNKNHGTAAILELFRPDFAVAIFSTRAALAVPAGPG